MKKYFNKIVLVLILVVIFPMSSGLCFQNLLALPAKINIAHAAENMPAMDGLSTNNLINDQELCGPSENTDSNREFFTPGFNKIDYSKMNNQAKADEFKPLPMPANHKSVLPCCLEGNQPGLVVSAQSEIPEFVFFAGHSASDFNKLPLNISKKISYQAPLFAPPELKALQTTILRI